MKKRNPKWGIIAIIGYLFFFVVSPVIAKYSSVISKNLTINARQPEYTVIFNANAPAGETASGTMANQSFTYGTSQALTTNDYTITGYLFTGWNTSADGTGTMYIDEESVSNLTDVDGGYITLYAQWSDNVAVMDGVYYKTLQAAVNAVPNNTQKTITLISNTSESVNIPRYKNIIFDFQNYTITNSGDNRIFDNNGTIEIHNGTIRSSTAHACIDNEQNGILRVFGGQIIATGDRGAIYNNKGVVEISGNAYLSSSITVEGDRGTVSNLAGGTVTITGGTIISTTDNAIYSLGTLTIGTADNDPDPDSLLIRGAKYGVSGTQNFSFYDGTIEGKTAAVNNFNHITNVESGYSPIRKTVTIDGQTYQQTYLNVAVAVTFDPNGGTLADNIYSIEQGTEIGTLPVPTPPAGKAFVGWFTDPDTGTQIDEHTIINAITTFYAHYEERMVAEINGTRYKTFQAAVNAAPNNTRTVITAINDSTENITVGSTKNIVFDIGSYTINNSTNKSVITNQGITEIISGTITTNSANASAINNDPGGNITISGGSVIATGQRQALYNDGGTVLITGDAYLSSKITATGDRGTVQNLANGTMVITGGTMISTTNLALYNVGTLTIGDKDGTIDTTTPVFQGGQYGIKSTANFNFYDGISKGITGAINTENKIVDMETGAQIAHGTETIDGATYQTAYLE